MERLIKKLVLKGSPKEIGLKHGSEGKEQIMHSLETYEKLFYGYQKKSWKEARELALNHLEAIEKYDPTLIEEMEGVAQGSGLDFEDILALNARSEIALAGLKSTAFSDGCTSIALARPAISETIIGQNWDWKKSQQKSLLLLEIQQESKPNITMFTEGGMIGKIGMNSAGIGICFNALLTDKKTNEVPIHLGLRSVLNSASLPEAVSRVKEKQMACAANFLIGSDDGHGNGMAVNIEVSPFGSDMVGEADGQIVHTNHILSDKLLHHLNDMNDFKFDDSMLRKKRAEQLIHSMKVNNAPISEESFQEWFADEFNAPNAINHHENLLAPEHRRMETVFSIVMNLSKRKIMFCLGKPSEGHYEEI